MSSTTLPQWLEELLQATGLPLEPIQAEVKRLIQKNGLASQDLTIEDLREVLVDYLQDTLLEAKQAYSQAE